MKLSNNQKLFLRLLCKKNKTSYEEVLFFIEHYLIFKIN